MPIVGINIKNYKCLKDISLRFDDNYDLYCLLGKNGTGKSNVLDALNYFYENMISFKIKNDVFDNENIYVQNMEISIIYDFSVLLKMSTNEYIEGVIRTLKKHFNNRKQILIKMTQNKKGEINWYPKGRKILRNIFSIFPIYHVNTRFIDLNNWEILWDIISDIAKTPAKIDEDKFNLLIDNILEETYKEKYKKSSKIIEEVLDREDINLYKHDYKNKYKDILAVRFGGREFLSDGNKPEYYSDGINSFRYLKLLLKFISGLSTMSWKEPLLLIDEPEIGLHSSFIYELADVIKGSVASRINSIITTHSADLICELMKNGIRICIYRMDILDNYSTIEKMNEIIEESHKHRLTINEVRCYFADAIVMVEGVSDLEVLTNLKIREIFPRLKKIEFYNMDSDDIRFKFVSPDKRKFSIPYLTILDMDKIIEPKEDNYKESISYRINSNANMNPLSNKDLEKNEKCLFYSGNRAQNKKESRFNLGVSIKNVLNDSKFNIEDPGYYVKDNLYVKLIEKIKTYCLQYNIYPFTTTIEGALINVNNYGDAYNWLKKEKEVNLGELDGVLGEDEKWFGKENKEYRTTVLRLICNGKYDSLHKLEKLGTGISEGILNSIGRIGKKASGWINDWIEYYFKENIDGLNDLEAKREKFGKDFPELFFVLKLMENLL